ncbi:MAG: hypothetical protein NC828_01115 [Candidatus Omnitrophica bacterium]|nr:hypothetical protein [Candidatus Omnitrophota bacterium]
MKPLCLTVAIAFTLSLITPVLSAEERGAQKVLKEGLLGAGVGAVAASASGGKAGKGALIGAGANIAGEAIMGALTAEPVQPSQQTTATVTEVAAPSLYQQGYEAGYQKGFDAGYEKGYNAGLAAKR